MKFLSVTETLVNEIRKEIITGQLPPGDKLNEVEMSDRMEVSRPPLREAFRKLEYENLVVSIARKGVFVTELSAEDCQQVYFVRHVLECSAIDMFEKKGIQHLPLVRKALDIASNFRQTDPQTPDEMMQYFNIMSDYHRKLVEASGNNWLTHCYSSIGSSLARYQTMYLTIPGIQQPSMDVHLEIMELIENGKYKAAKKLLKVHIKKAGQKIIQELYRKTSS